MKVINTFSDLPYSYDILCKIGEIYFKEPVNNNISLNEAILLANFIEGVRLCDPYWLWKSQCVEAFIYLKSVGVETKEKNTGDFMKIMDKIKMDMMNRKIILLSNNAPIYYVNGDILKILDRDKDDSTKPNSK